MCNRRDAGNRAANNPATYLHNGAKERAPENRQWSRFRKSRARGQNASSPPARQVAEADAAAGLRYLPGRERVRAALHKALEEAWRRSSGGARRQNGPMAEMLVYRLRAQKQPDIFAA